MLFLEHILVKRQYSTEKLDSLSYRTMITFHPNFYLRSKQKRAKDIITANYIFQFLNSEKVCRASIQCFQYLDKNYIKVPMLITQDYAGFRLTRSGILNET